MSRSAAPAPSSPRKSACRRTKARTGASGRAGERRVTVCGTEATLRPETTRSASHSIAGVAGPAHRMTFESFGVVAEVASDDEALLGSVGDLLPPGWRRAGGTPQAEFTIAADGTITLDGREVAFPGEGVDTRLRLGSLVRHHLAELVTGHVFLHAGVVSAGATTLVIPGAPHS